MWEVNTARSSLRSHLDIQHALVFLRRARSIQTGKSIQTEPGAEENQHHVHPDHPKDTAWAWRIKQMMQSLSLITAFEGAFYVMHVGHNISANGFHWAWKINVLFPIFLSLCVMLPMIISRFTLVEAYFTPEHDAMDSVLTFMEQHEEDIRYMHKAWLHSGRPMFIDPGTHLTIIEFSQVLKRNGMQASQARQKRVFKTLDIQEVGHIDIMRLLEKLMARDAQAALTQRAAPTTGAPKEVPQTPR